MSSKMYLFCAMSRVGVCDIPYLFLPLICYLYSMYMWGAIGLSIFVQCIWLYFFPTFFFCETISIKIWQKDVRPYHVGTQKIPPVKIFLLRSATDLFNVKNRIYWDMRFFFPFQPFSSLYYKTHIDQKCCWWNSWRAIVHQKQIFLVLFRSWLGSSLQSVPHSLWNTTNNNTRTKTFDIFFSF